MLMFASPRLQNFLNMIDPLRYKMSWFVPHSTPEQFTAAKDVISRTKRLESPSSTPRRCAHAIIQSQEIANEKISIEKLSRNHYTNPTTIDKKSTASIRQPTRLRIFREIDRNVAPHCAGRMVISGSMQDVCAEIDRLSKTRG